MLRVLLRPVGDARHLAALGVAATALFLALFFSVQAGLLFLAAAWLAVGTWRYPWPAFLLLVSVAPLLLGLKATVTLGAVTSLKDVVILTLFARVLASRGSFLPIGLTPPLVALLAWDLVALLRADAPVLGLLRFRDLVLYVPMIVVVLRLVSGEERRLETFLRVFLWTGFGVLVLAAVQWVFLPDSMVLRFESARSTWVPRAASVMAHPNHLGAYLLFLVPLGGVLAVVRGVTRDLRVLGGGVALGGLVAAYATYSRSVWIALPLALLTIILVSGLRRRRWFAGGVLLLVGLVVLSLLLIPGPRERLRALADPTYASNRTRLDIVAESLADVSASGAVVGEGLGDTVRLLRRTAEISLHDVVSARARAVQGAKARTFVDNAVVKTWLEQGVVGVVFILWFGWRLFSTALAAARAESPPLLRSIALAFSGILLGLAALWWFLDVPDMFPVNLFFWTFAGVVAARSALSSSVVEGLR